MIFGYLLAVVATVASGSGSVLESVGVRRAGVYGGRSQDLWRLLRQPLYFLGIGVDIVGFGLAAVALHLLPLFLVQSLMAFSVGVTAAICGLLGTRISGGTWLMLGCGAVGLVLLGISAEPGPARPLPAMWGLSLFAVPVVCAVIGVVAVRARSRWSPALLAFGSGAGFSTAGVSARTFVPPDTVWHIVAEPHLWAMAANGLAAASLFALSLQRSGATAVTAVMFTTNTTLSALIGLLYLDDHVRAGLAIVAVVGFVVAIAGAIGTAHVSADAVHGPELERPADPMLDEPDPAGVG